MVYYHMTLFSIPVVCLMVLCAVFMNSAGPVDLTGSFPQGPTNIASGVEINFFSRGPPAPLPGNVGGAAGKLEGQTKKLFEQRT